jgi:hypothetical protein
MRRRQQPQRYFGGYNDVKTMTKRRKVLRNSWRLAGGFVCLTLGWRFLGFTIAYIRELSPYAGLYGALSLACIAGLYVCYRGAWQSKSS